MSSMYNGGDPTPTDNDDCEVCGVNFDAHSEADHLDCNLARAMQELPKTGLYFLILDMDNCWEWVDLDGMGCRSIQLAKAVYKDGVCLEDLGG